MEKFIAFTYTLALAFFVSAQGGMPEVNLDAWPGDSLLPAPGFPFEINSNAPGDFYARVYWFADCAKAYAEAAKAAGFTIEQDITELSEGSPIWMFETKDAGYVLVTVLYNAAADIGGIAVMYPYTE